MTDTALEIVFRNPRPQRGPIDTELYLLRRDGSCAHINYTTESELPRPKEPTALLVPEAIQ